MLDNFSMLIVMVQCFDVTGPDFIPCHSMHLDSQFKNISSSIKLNIVLLLANHKAHSVNGHFKFRRYSYEISTHKLFIAVPLKLKCKDIVIRISFCTVPVPWFYVTFVVPM